MPQVIFGPVPVQPGVNMGKGVVEQELYRHAESPVVLAILAGSMGHSLRHPPHPYGWDKVVSGPKKAADGTGGVGLDPRVRIWHKASKSCIWQVTSQGS